MSAANVQMYCGTGLGRSAAAVGRAVKTACEGKTVFIVRFMKGKGCLEYQFLQRLEPEIKLFCFDKYDQPYCELGPEEQKEEQIHMKNGISYANKVAATGECDLLVLDEVLDMIADGIVDEEEIISLIQGSAASVSVILTGMERCERIWPYVQKVYEISTLKESE